VVFKYDDFLKALKEYGVDKIVGVYLRKKVVSELYTEVEVRASASSKDVQIELIYHRVLKPTATINEESRNILSKAKELVEMLKKNGYDVVEGYWGE